MTADCGDHRGGAGQEPRVSEDKSAVLRIESRDGCNKEPAAKSPVPEPQAGEPAAGDCHGGSREILARRETDLPGEPCCSTCAQVFVPFLLAGMGSVAASLLLDRVKDWPVYSTYRELFVLIPPLLGLNGNLEMTLVARLSTQVAVQTFDRGDRKSVV